MKKWLLIFSVAGLLAVSLLFLLVDNTGISYTTITPKKAEKIRQQMKPAEDLDFALTFDGEELAFDAGSKTYFLPLSMDTDQWENGEISATNQIQVMFLEDFSKEDKSVLMKENASIPFMAVKDGFYETFNLKISGLPIMTFEGTDFQTDSGDLLYKVKLYETFKKDWVTSCFTTSRLRGNTSLTYEKNSLRLNLKKQKKDGSFTKKNLNLLGLRDDDDWILNSLYADNTRMRDKIAADLWADTGAYNNPYGKCFGFNGEYVEVFINKNYAGLYLLTYPIDGKQLGIDKTSTQVLAGKDMIERIYKKKYTAIWNESEFTGDLPDQNQPDFRGGFYVKGDMVNGSLEEWYPLYEMARCLNSDDVTFTNNIDKIADISNIVDNWLFFQGIGGFDNENKNYYYTARNKNGAYYGYFIPWDLNISFGAVYADNKYYCAETMKETKTVVAFQPGQRVIDLNAVDSRQLVKNRWKEWRNGPFKTEHVLNEIEDLSARLNDSGAMIRESERWPEGNASSDHELMKEFTIERLEFLDGYIDSL